MKLSLGHVLWQNLITSILEPSDSAERVSELVCFVMVGERKCMFACIVNLSFHQLLSVITKIHIGYYQSDVLLFHYYFIPLPNISLMRSSCTPCTVGLNFHALSHLS